MVRRFAEIVRSDMLHNQTPHADPDVVSATKQANILIFVIPTSFWVVALCEAISANHAHDDGVVAVTLRAAKARLGLRAEAAATFRNLSRKLKFDFPACNH